MKKLLKKIENWIFQRTHGYWLKWRINNLSQQNIELTKQIEQANKTAEYYSQLWRNDWAKISKLERKLEKAKAWNNQTHEAIKKLKEQSTRDHEYAKQQQQRIEDLKAEISLLWQGREISEIVKIA